MAPDFAYNTETSSTNVGTASVNNPTPPLSLLEHNEKRRSKTPIAPTTDAIQPAPPPKVFKVPAEEISKSCSPSTPNILANAASKPILAASPTTGMLNSQARTARKSANTDSGKGGYGTSSSGSSRNLISSPKRREPTNFGVVTGSNAIAKRKLANSMEGPSITSNINIQNSSFCVASPENASTVPRKQSPAEVRSASGKVEPAQSLAGTKLPAGVLDIPSGAAAEDTSPAMTKPKRQKTTTSEIAALANDAGINGDASFAKKHGSRKRKELDPQTQSTPFSGTAEISVPKKRGKYSAKDKLKVYNPTATMQEPIKFSSNPYQNTCSENFTQPADISRALPIKEGQVLERAADLSAVKTSQPTQEYPQSYQPPQPQQESHSHSQPNSNIHSHVIGLASKHPPQTTKISSQFSHRDSTSSKPRAINDNFARICDSTSSTPTATPLTTPTPFKAALQGSQSQKRKVVNANVERQSGSVLRTLSVSKKRLQPKLLLGTDISTPIPIDDDEDEEDEDSYEPMIKPVTPCISNSKAIINQKSMSDTAKAASVEKPSTPNIGNPKSEMAKNPNMKDLQAGYNSRNIEDLRSKTYINDEFWERCINISTDDVQSDLRRMIKQVEGTLTILVDEVDRFYRSRPNVKVPDLSFFEDYQKSYTALNISKRLEFLFDHIGVVTEDGKLMIRRDWAASGKAPFYGTMVLFKFLGVWEGKVKGVAELIRSLDPKNGNETALEFSAALPSQFPGGQPRESRNSGMKSAQQHSQGNWSPAQEQTPPTNNHSSLQNSHAATKPTPENLSHLTIQGEPDACENSNQQSAINNRVEKILSVSADNDPDRSAKKVGIEDPPASSNHIDRPTSKEIIPSVNGVVQPKELPTVNSPIMKSSNQTHDPFATKTPEIAVIEGEKASMPPSSPKEESAKKQPTALHPQLDSTEVHLPDLASVPSGRSTDQPSLVSVKTSRKVLGKRKIEFKDLIMEYDAWEQLRSRRFPPVASQYSETGDPLLARAREVDREIEDIAANLHHLAGVSQIREREFTGRLEAVSRLAPVDDRHPGECSSYDIDWVAYRKVIEEKEVFQLETRNAQLKLISNIAILKQEKEFLVDRRKRQRIHGNAATPASDHFKESNSAEPTTGSTQLGNSSPHNLISIAYPFVNGRFISGNRATEKFLEHYEMAKVMTPSFSLSPPLLESRAASETTAGNFENPEEAQEMSKKSKPKKKAYRKRLGW